MSDSNSRSELMLVREMTESIVNVLGDGLYIHDTVDPIWEFSLKDTKNESFNE